MNIRIKERCKGLECNSLVLRLILLLMISFAIVVVWMLFAPIKVYEIDGPYKTLSSEYSPGDTVEVRQTYCKLRDFPARIDIALIDGYTESLRSIRSNVPIGCYDRYSTSVAIPEYTIPGEYKIRYLFTVEVNPLRTETYIVETEPFIVTAE